MSQTIWIARHGNRQDNVDKQWMKTAKWPDDPGLSPDGIIQAKELAERLAKESIKHIFCSPFLRTIETASQTARVLDLKIKIEAGLGEWHSAGYYSEPGPAIIPLMEKAKLFPEIDLAYSSNVLPSYPETFEEMELRVGKAVQNIIRNFSGDMLLVGHGASVDASARGLIREKTEINSSLCCLLKVVRNDGRWILELNNDTSHLSNPILDA